MAYHLLHYYWASWAPLLGEAPATSVGAAARRGAARPAYKSAARGPHAPLLQPEGRHRVPRSSWSSSVR